MIIVIIRDTSLSDDTYCANEFLIIINNDPTRREGPQEVMRFHISGGLLDFMINYSRSSLMLYATQSVLASLQWHLLPFVTSLGVL